jgi:hypothetical protein
MLLAVLEDGPRHGYAIMESLRVGSAGRFDLPTGAIYRRCAAWAEFSAAVTALLVPKPPAVTL